MKLFLLLSFIALLIVFSGENIRSESQIAEFLFGVGSLFTPEHIGGPHALLGYTYNTKTLQRCFQQINVFNIHSAPKHPDSSLTYTSEQVDKHVTYPGMS